MRVPSGDQTGVRYSPCTGVRSFSPVPAPDTTKIPGAPNRRLGKATRPGPAGGLTVAEVVAPEGFPADGPVPDGLEAPLAPGPPPAPVPPGPAVAVVAPAAAPVV